ncbi:type VI secretion system baseplate subunit TssG [Aliivibrio finisterrensis]|uniref:type VI secretion system baseplate subunit TssG n=1 Tax=Aliivibrio finisterrensis TaxID=511998 RepID=UPI00102145A0|nr:type VI secretion system baseplate subunit TssG [Aliivibrio finisterrensis]RYU71307.1 type VI secretion system baseplate subunit TssG [Aliivibrio finisterrensis]RYU75035.1 type VI secretion system baseplate subunit TssG [Aliivibrio finisterrensis]RYU77480.1 type VI secretion system baseplate subunit TssG [Aliivibrio finisterrensis]
MATTNGTATSYLTEEAAPIVINSLPSMTVESALALNISVENIGHLSLMKALDHVCYQLCSHYDLSHDDAYERIQFIANPSQGFAPREIQSVSVVSHNDGLPKIIMTLNMLSLIGASSPLPHYYNDYLLQDEHNVLKPFLDIFHHRLHRLIRNVWQKYRYNAAFREGADDPFSQHIFALLGLKSEELRDDKSINWPRLFPYLGLLSQRVRSANTIEALLRYYFQHSDIHIEECILRHCHIPEKQLCSLGVMNSSLSSNVVLGDSAPDRANKFRIHITQLTWEHFHSFLTDKPNWIALNRLVQFTVKDPLDFDIQLHLKDDEPRPLTLSDSNECCLGWTSWLGSSANEGRITLSGKTL